MGAFPRSERLRRLVRGQCAHRVRADEERRVAAAAPVRPLVADPSRRSDLPHGAPRRRAVDDGDRSAGRKGPVGAPGADREDERRRQAQQPGVPESGRGGRRDLRVLPRLRDAGVRRERQGALEDAARAVQQHLRHGRVTGHRWRPGYSGVRSEHGIVSARRRQADRPAEVEDDEARGQERTLDADPLARGRRQGRDSPSGIVPAHGATTRRRARRNGGCAGCRSR